MNAPDLLRDVIEAYISTVQDAFSLMQQNGFPPPKYPDEWIDYIQLNNIKQKGMLRSAPPIGYFLHGIGCCVDLPSGSVDWDFGYECRIDGFDAGRLWYFANDRREQFPGLTDRKSFEALFAEANHDGSVVRPFVEHADFLYYLQ